MKNPFSFHSSLTRKLIPSILTAAMLFAAVPSTIFAEAADSAETAEAADSAETAEASESTEAAESTAPDVSTIPEATPTPVPNVLNDVAPVGIRFAKNWQEVYDALKKADYYNDYYIYDDVVEYEMYEEAAVSDAAPSAGSSMKESAASPQMETGSAISPDSDDYSKLNTREQNVDEADVVRTDGQYIYTLNSDGFLYIAKAAGKDSALVSSGLIYPSFFSDHLPGFDPSYMDPKEMYLDNGRLNVIFSITKSYYSPYDYYDYVSDTDYDDADLSGPHTLRNGTCILTFDVSDPASPVMTGACWQNGSYSTSRKIGETLYLYTEMRPYLADSAETSMLVPCVNGEALPADVFCIPNYISSASYLIVSSMDINAPSEMIDSKVFVSGAEDFYVSESNLYILNTGYTNNSTKTEIARFSLDAGSIQPGAASTVIGAVNDSFSIDEYDGYLRVLTTYTGSDLGPLAQLIAYFFGIDLDDPWTRHNSVYVLKMEDLSFVSRLNRLAEGEDIKSARFFGDIAYFVTFRNTDPLFTADLSDPAKPAIIGQLDVTGFSSYLHPYGDGLLLGMGYEASEFGTVTGLKLSMFDTSDPSNVREIDRVVIPGITYCEAMENYKTVLADARKNLIGFYCQERYLVYSYKQGTGFQRVLLYDLFEDGLTNRSKSFTARGLYSGTDLYVAGDDFLISFDMKNGFQKDVAVDYTAAFSEEDL